MKKGGAVLTVIGGVAGVVQSVACILSSAVDIRLGGEYSVLLFIMGWVGLILSMILLVLGAFIFKNSKRIHCLMSVACSLTAVVLACIIYFYFVISTPIEQIDSSLGVIFVQSEVVTVLWTAGWYIAIFFVLGLVGGIMTMIGISRNTQDESESLTV